VYTTCTAQLCKYVYDTLSMYLTIQPTEEHVAFHKLSMCRSVAAASK